MGYLAGGIQGFADHYKKKKKKSPVESGGATSSSSSGSYSPLSPEGKIIGSFRKGGRVKRTGNYKLHRGERVLNTKQVKRARGRRSKSR